MSTLEKLTRFISDFNRVTEDIGKRANAARLLANLDPSLKGKVKEEGRKALQNMAERLRTIAEEM